VHLQLLWSVILIIVVNYSALTQISPKDSLKAVAFINVNVIPMNRTRVLHNRTVIIRGARITQIGAAPKTRIPKGALIIDGRGNYLMPALADMHTHLYDPDSRSLLSYLISGVTTIRVMNGRPFQLQWREQIRRGELLGPTIYAAGPTIYGRANSSSARAGFKEPTTVGEASQLVAEYKRAGYDFIKVYSFLSPELYAALVGEAEKQDIRVVGHVPWSVGIKGVLAGRQSSVEHLFGYLEALETEESQKRSDVDFRNLFHAIEFREAQLPALARATREAGVWNSPTMVFFEKRLPFSGAREAWEQPALRKLGHENRKKVVRALHVAGAKLLLGTDSGEGQGSVMPDSILDELELLVEAGLTPYEAIKTGTVNAAEYLNALSEFGTVSEGKRADLLIIECNPLSDVRCVRKPVGVMIRGRWLMNHDLKDLAENSRELKQR
jgi:imidazolonepropionase-like amidohydrolase